jgi:hypothetical protein
MEMIAVATASGDDCDDAPEVETTSGGEAVDVGAGTLRLIPVGCGKGDDVATGFVSLPGVTITAAWAVTAVLLRGLTTDLWPISRTK